MSVADGVAVAGDAPAATGAKTKAAVHVVPHENNICIDFVGEDFVMVLTL